MFYETIGQLLSTQERLETSTIASKTSWNYRENIRIDIL